MMEGSRLQIFLVNELDELDTMFEKECDNEKNKNDKILLRKKPSRKKHDDVTGASSSLKTTLLGTNSITAANPRRRKLPSRMESFRLHSKTSAPLPPSLFRSNKKDHDNGNKNDLLTSNSGYKTGNRKVSRDYDNGKENVLITRHSGRKKAANRRMSKDRGDDNRDDLMIGDFGHKTITSRRISRRCKEPLSRRRASEVNVKKVYSLTSGNHKNHERRNSLRRGGRSKSNNNRKSRRIPSSDRSSSFQQRRKQRLLMRQQQQRRNESDRRSSSGELSKSSASRVPRRNNSNSKSNRSVQKPYYVLDTSKKSITTKKITLETCGSAKSRMDSKTDKEKSSSRIKESFSSAKNETNNMATLRTPFKTSLSVQNVNSTSKSVIKSMRMLVASRNGRASSRRPLLIDDVEIDQLSEEESVSINDKEELPSHVYHGYLGRCKNDTSIQNDNDDSKGRESLFKFGCKNPNEEFIGNDYETTDNEKSKTRNQAAAADIDDNRIINGDHSDKQKKKKWKLTSASKFLRNSLTKQVERQKLSQAERYGLFKSMSSFSNFSTRDVAAPNFEGQ